MTIYLVTRKLASGCHALIGCYSTEGEARDASPTRDDQIFKLVVGQRYSPGHRHIVPVCQHVAENGRRGAWRDGVLPALAGVLAGSE